VLTDRVRLHCAAVAAGARHVSIDADVAIASGGISGLDQTLHFLEGAPEEVARYVLIATTLVLLNRDPTYSGLIPGPASAIRRLRSIQRHRVRVANKSFDMAR